MAHDIERSVIITGAGSGIGAAAARRIAGPGTAILIHARKNADGLKALLPELEAAGSRVIIALGDLADADVAPRLVAEARQHFGRVDQIVSNAGQAQRARFGAFSAADLEQALASMPIAFFRLAETALQDLETSPWGRVVAVSSFIAHAYGTADLLFGATSAAKAALESLAGTLAYQLAPIGTTVNCVAPGFTAKSAGGHSAAPQGEKSRGPAATPNGRAGQPEDVAAAIGFLLSREASHITGETLHVNGGLLLPGGKR